MSRFLVYPLSTDSAWTALSGVGYVGILPALKMAFALSHLTPPAKHTTVGTGMSSFMSTMILATLSRSAVSSGDPMMTSPPTSGSLVTMSMTSLKYSGFASPRTSMGLVSPATVGTRTLISSMVFSENLTAYTLGASNAASADMTPRPPALVMMAIPSFSIGPQLLNTLRASNMSSRSWAL